MNNSNNNNTNKNLNNNKRRKPKRRQAPRRGVNKTKKFRPFSSVNLSSTNYGKNYPQFIKRMYNKDLTKYIEGILEPSIPVNTGLIVKQPSLLPIPSSTVAFRNNINISTDQAGDFFLAWNPNFLINNKVLESIRITGKGTDGANTILSPNCFSNICTKDTTNNSLKFYPSYVPSVDLSKYRLVSAKIKITYIGSNLNKSGMLYGCATYDPAPIVLGFIDPGSQVMYARDASNNIIDYSVVSDSSNYNRLGYPTAVTYEAMTEQNISNGIWNRSCNVVQTNQGISCLHVPSDPTSQIFYPLGTYFGSGRVASTATFNNLVLSDCILPIQYQSTTGSQLSYLICGHGLPQNNECINIQVFYNFEIIPTTLSAPFMRVDSMDLNPQQYNIINEVVHKTVPNISIRTGQSKELTTGFSKSFTNIFNTMKMVHSFISLFSKFI